MSEPGDLGDLNSSQWNRLQERLDALEKAWKKGDAVDWLQFVPALGSSTRTATLYEVIKTDLQCRWQNGQGVVLDYYLDKLPEELGNRGALPASLIHWEFHVRQTLGDRPPIEQYHARFPAQFAELQKLVESTTLQPKAPARPPPEQYKTRLPDQDDELRGLVQSDKPQTGTAPYRPSSASATPRPEKVPTVRDELPFMPSRNRELPQIGGYTLIERLGRGSFAEVWKARAPGGVLKAIKIISRPIDQAESQQEEKAMQLIKNLRHHFLLPIHAFWILEDRLVILMDLADETLRDCLNKHRKEGRKSVPLPELLKYMRQTTEALDYLHSKKVQHRDIKPENILLAEGHVRVADLGLARAQGTMRMATATFVGTPVYMPPETWQNQIHINGDQYSLAATYVELRCGRHLFQGSYVSQMNGHLHETPRLEPLEAAEQKVLLKALAKNPEDRYASCLEFWEELVKATQPGALSAEAAPPAPGEGQARRGWIVALAAGLALAGVLLWSLWQPPSHHTLLPPPASAGSFRPVEGAKMVALPARGKERKYLSHIECLVGSQPVVFVLIPWETPGKRSYYIMVDKVSNSLFGAFAESQPQELSGSRWRLGGRRDRQPNEPWSPELFACSGGLATEPWARNLLTPFYLENPYALPYPDDVGSADGALPALRVDIVEAQRFAGWLGGLLPSVEQWDHAAGRDEKEPGEGPFVAPWQEGEISVNRGDQGPMPVGTAGKDRSRLGCNDMAGNGLEWTRTWQDDVPGEFVGELGKIPLQARAVLRGRSYADAEPLHFDDLVDRVLTFPFFESERNLGHQATLPQIGFRVVIDVDF
jgi:formylglycine-generating enzyme required for sulfatase activity/tRNA A-37 threonylcarbamoyl transferase component Bud32